MELEEKTSRAAEDMLYKMLRPGAEEIAKWDSSTPVRRLMGSLVEMRYYVIHSFICSLLISLESDL